MKSNSMNDADDVETAQSSHQLTEDKKDVALETELETRTPSSSIIVVSKISFSFHLVTSVMQNSEMRGIYNIC
ncbi:unnamed protein product [Thelazia callipaeda]|uniref:Ovule protein n=1 Tax=Thelazia callipaeda TaxID=103827 RepID=A0A0N5D055_THECL|nr:unnamed protein product [Thelazia callipaeda]